MTTLMMILIGFGIGVMGLWYRYAKAVYVAALERDRRAARGAFFNASACRQPDKRRAGSLH